MQMKGNFELLCTWFFKKGIRTMSFCLRKISTYHFTNFIDILTHLVSRIYFAIEEEHFFKYNL